MAKKSALSESHGNPKPSNVNRASIEKIRSHRTKNISVDTVFQGIIQGNHTYLSKGITLVESSLPQHQSMAGELVERCLLRAGKSIRIGITGVPGVGKSSFIEVLGSLLSDAGKKVAVLAVDPSSTISRGSILGDKTRMETLVNNPRAYIRPSPSGDSLGGVARKTRESIVLCEAAGFDTILVETVGVGQSETSVHSMTDFFLLLKIAGTGDELQGIKRGIIEMADAIVINKAEGDNRKAARQAASEFKRALKMYPVKDSGWRPPVLLASALEVTGITQVWEMINQYQDKVNQNGYFELKRQQQNRHWLLQTINEHLKDQFYSNPDIKASLAQQLEAVEQGKTSPFMAARQLLELHKKQSQQ